MLGLGLIFGSVMESATTAKGNMREWYLNMAAADDLLDALITSFIELAGMMVAVYAVSVLLRMREEEVRGRLEPVLAGAVARPRWVMSYVLTVGLGVVVLLGAFAVGMALTAGQARGDTSGLLRELTGAAPAQEVGAVAIAVMLALAAAFSAAGLAAFRHRDLVAG